MHDAELPADLRVLKAQMKTIAAQAATWEWFVLATQWRGAAVLGWSVVAVISTELQWGPHWAELPAALLPIATAAALIGAVKVQKRRLADRREMQRVIPDPDPSPGGQTVQILGRSVDRAAALAEVKAFDAQTTVVRWFGIAVWWRGFGAIAWGFGFLLWARWMWHWPSVLPALPAIAALFAAAIGEHVQRRHLLARPEMQVVLPCSPQPTFPGARARTERKP